MFIQKLCGKPWSFNGHVFDDREPESFFIPLSLISDDQYTASVTRNNRLLAVGHRMRGDVGVMS